MAQPPSISTIVAIMARLLLEAWDEQEMLFGGAKIIPRG